MSHFTESDGETPTEKSPAAESCNNKEEYLADLRLYAEKRGRVFPYSDIMKADGDFSICSASVALELIRDYIAEDEDIPFRVSFEENMPYEEMPCFTDSGRLAGAVMSALSVAAKLSDDMMCRLSFITDSGSAVVEAECTLARELNVRGHDDRFGDLSPLIPAEPEEVSAFEVMEPSAEWRGEYAVHDGKAVIRAILDRDEDGDRLKYRDAAEALRQALMNCARPVRDSFSLYSEEQCEDQKNITHTSGIPSFVRGDNEYYGAEQEIVRG